MSRAERNIFGKMENLAGVMEKTALPCYIIASSNRLQEGKIHGRCASRLQYGQPRLGAEGARVRRRRGRGGRVRRRAGEVRLLHSPRRRQLRRRNGESETARLRPGDSGIPGAGRLFLRRLPRHADAARVERGGARSGGTRHTRRIRSTASSLPPTRWSGICRRARRRS